jgi:D-sedoheptulose 7-phosphate isomerase
MLECVQSTTHAVADEYLASVARATQLVPTDPLHRVIGLIIELRAAGRRIYVMGNGGSAANASHFVCDLVKTTQVDGVPGVRAYALTDNTPTLTAWANDHAYEYIFAEQIVALVEPGDLVIGFSASGSSPNIVAGFEAANRRKAHTVGIVGFDGGRARDLVDLVIHVPCHEYGVTEDIHAAIAHAITAAVRAAAEPADQSGT